MRAAERAGERLAMPEDGFDKVGQLPLQRLAQFDFGTDDIAVTHQQFEFTERAGMRLTDRNALFVDTHAFEAIEIIEHQTLAAADDYYLADFIGVRPAYVNIANDVVRVAEGDEGHIFAHISQRPRADGAGPLRLLVQQVIEDGDIVRGQIPNGVDVRTNGAEVRARGVQVIHASEIGRLDVFTQLLNSGIVQEGVRHHQDEALLIGEFP